eukprot:3975804-Pleurochrysis_carterae.AAC.5
MRAGVGVGTLAVIVGAVAAIVDASVDAVADAVVDAIVDAIRVAVAAVVLGGAPWALNVNVIVSACKLLGVLDRTDVGVTDGEVDRLVEAHPLSTELAWVVELLGRHRVEAGDAAAEETLCDQLESMALERPDPVPPEKV